MRLRSYLPSVLWRMLRNSYWRRHWQQELEDQRESLTANAPAYLAGSERAVLAEAIVDCYPFSNLLEVGCSYGQLFHTIAPLLPHVRMLGIDPDKEKIDAGRPLADKAGFRNVEYKVGRAEDLSFLQDKSFDLVVASAALLYVPPQSIETAIREFIRVGRRKLLFLEQHVPETDDALGLPGQHRGREAPYWMRNYVELMRRFLDPARIKADRVPKPLWGTESWQESAYLVTVDL